MSDQDHPTVQDLLAALRADPLAAPERDTLRPLPQAVVRRLAAEGELLLLPGGVVLGPDAAAHAGTFVVPTTTPNLSLIPASRELAGAEIELIALPDRERRLRLLLEPLRTEFDTILIDSPPSLGLLTLNALVAADRVLIPLHCEYFALEGLAGLLDTLSLVQRELNPRLTVAGMLLTMHDGRTKLGQDVEREVREHFPHLVFDTVIPRNVRLGEAPSFGRPVIHHDPHCAGSEAYFALAKEVASRG